MKHHGFRESQPPVTDDAQLEELRDRGLLDIDYSGNAWKVVPTPEGRELVAQHDRLLDREPVADLAPLLDATAAQAGAGNKLAWASVQPVLAALRDYWEGGGFSPHGIQLAAVLGALPDEHEGLFSATIRALVEGGYLRPATALGVNDVPAAVELTERAYSVLDGWPGASPDELVNKLLTVLTAAAAAEPDPVRKKRLERLAETVKEVGVSTAGDVLAKVLTGGA